MNECGCVGLGAWTSLVFGSVATALFVVGVLRLELSRRRLLRAARELEPPFEA
jgi:hypothetical protein